MKIYIEKKCPKCKSKYIEIIIRREKNEIIFKSIFCDECHYYNSIRLDEAQDEKD